MSSREAFEQWAIKNWRYLSLTKGIEGAYDDCDTSLAWDTWLAATERAANICAAMGNSSSVEYAGHGCVVAADKIREGNE